MSFGRRYLRVAAEHKVGSLKLVSIEAFGRLRPVKLGSVTAVCNMQRCRPRRSDGGKDCAGGRRRVAWWVCQEPDVEGTPEGDGEGVSQRVRGRSPAMQAS